jgi:hypothetical protein
VEARASTLVSTNLTNYVKFPPPLTDDDLKAGRLTDHEFFSRACCLTAWLFFAVCLGMVALFRFRLPAVARRLVPRIRMLLRPVDYAWLIGGGILLPYAYMMVINRFTPLGGRDWSIRGLPMAQFLGMALLMLVVPVLVARWRLSRRIAGDAKGLAPLDRNGFGNDTPRDPTFPVQGDKPLGAGISPVRKSAVPGLGGGRSWMAWLAVFCAVVFIPLAGWIAPGEYQRDIYQPWVLGLLAVPAVWLLVASLRALFGRAKARLLVRGVIARALVPVYATAMLLMAAAALGHKTAERYWFQRDAIMRMDPAFPAMSPYEYKVARQLREEIREILREAP